MSDVEKIDLLEEEIIELKYQLKKSNDKEMVYLDILSNIDSGLKTLFKREEENKRFDMGDVIDYRENVVNLQNSLNEYKKIYKLNL
jgi:UTP-glucose-1-phosphate uridylyltransferase